MEHPYGLRELAHTTKENDRIRCHIAGCQVWVKRLSRGDQDSEANLCPIHRIHIHPTTYVYQDMLDNIIWQDEPDIWLFTSIAKRKRDQRFGHENSEDALTWNVFRGLLNFFFGPGI